MNPFNYLIFIGSLIFIFTISGCSFTVDRDRNDNIKIEKLEPIVEETKVNCDSERLKELEIAKCKMEARLMEIRY
jgi:hypothetical protein